MQSILGLLPLDVLLIYLSNLLLFVAVVATAVVATAVVVVVVATVVVVTVVAAVLHLEIIVMLILS